MKQQQRQRGEPDEVSGAALIERAAELERIAKVLMAFAAHRAGHAHGGYNCYACHESHGSTSKPFLLGHSMTVYTKTSTGGTCDPSCHGSYSYTVAYPR